MPLRAQIVTVADSASKTPVADAAFSAGGKIIYSGPQGRADLSSFGRNDTVLLTHISYTPVRIVISETASESIIFLVPAAINKEELVVSGESYPPTAEVVQIDEIKTASFTGLSDLIKNYTGFYVKDYGGISGIKLLSFRGMGSENTIVLFNEFRVNDLKTGTFDFSGLGSEAVDKIVMQHDDLSSVSPGGVLRLYSGNLTAQNNLYFLVGSDINGLQKWGGGINFSKNKFSAGAEFDRSVTSNEYNYDFEGSSYKRQNAFLNKSFFSGNANWMDQNTTVKLYSHYSMLYTGVPGFVVTNNTASNGSTNKNSSWLTTLKADHNILSGLRAEAGISYHNQSLNYHDPVREYFKPKSSEISRLDDINGMIRFNYSFNFLNVTAGYEFNYAGLDGLKNFLSSTGNTDKLSRTSNKINLGAVYSPGNIIPFMKNISLSSILSKEFIKERFAGELYNDSFSYLLRFSTRFSFDEGLFTTFAFFDTYRNPTFNERYYSVIFDPGLLRKEKFRGYEAAAVYRSGVSLLSEISAAWYDIESTDKIIWVPTGVALQIPRNLYKVASTGIELSANGAYCIISWGANYNYTSAKNRSASNPGDLTYNKQMIYTPLHRYSFRISAAISSVTLNAWLNYSSESFFTGDNDPFNKLESFYTVDVSAVLTISSGGANHLLSLSVYNLLNKEYMIVQSYPMPLLTAAFTYKFILEY